jgi:hypothetical protein
MSSPQMTKKFGFFWLGIDSSWLISYGPI